MDILATGLYSCGVDPDSKHSMVFEVDLSPVDIDKEKVIKPSLIDTEKLSKDKESLLFNTRIAILHVSVIMAEPTLLFQIYCKHLRAVLKHNFPQNLNYVLTFILSGKL